MSLEYNRTQSSQPQGQPNAPKAAQVNQFKLNAYLQEVRDNQSLGLGLLAGLAAAVVGAILWGVITVMAERQIGFMAIGVGFLVGWSVRRFGRGMGPEFAISGAVLSLLGCVLGNLFSACIFVANQMRVPLSDLLATLDWRTCAEWMKATFSPMDLLFYALAMYFGYKYSLFRIPEEKMKELVG